MTRSDLIDRRPNRYSQPQYKDATLQVKVILQHLYFISLSVFLMIPACAFCVEPDWNVGVYGGQYYDSEPAGFTQGRLNYLDHYIIALTTSRTIWRADAFPLSLEIDGTIAHQFGLATLQEIGIVPVLRWSGFPWNEILRTSVRFGTFGPSYATSISPLERGTNGKGSQFLNFLVWELVFSLPQPKSDEVFLRLHHRSTINDLLNNYGANGDDFFTLGYRQYL